MDDGETARADLRSYALRRCIRFYTAVLVVLLTFVGGALATKSAEWVPIVGSALLGVMAFVEVLSGVVMLDMAKARDRTAGPETPLWQFAQGPHPSWIAAAAFAGAAAFLLWLGLAA